MRSAAAVSRAGIPPFTGGKCHPGGFPLFWADGDDPGLQSNDVTRAGFCQESGQSFTTAASRFATSFQLTMFQNAPTYFARSFR